MGQDASHELLRRRRKRRLQLLFVIGTRPEAVKLAPLVHAARARRDVEVRLVGSGQHEAAMLDVLEHFDIDLDGSLPRFKSGLTLAKIASTGLLQLTREIEARAPDVVVVQGDTTTALAGALASFYRRIPVAHVEAGLRTHDVDRPFPEEMNRRLIDEIASFLFPPTAWAAANLIAEGLDGADVFITGNTIVDSLHWILARTPHPVPAQAQPFFDGSRWEGGVLVTAHRRESWGAQLESIASGVTDAARAAPSTVFLLPLHPNPIVRRAFVRRRETANVLVVEPLPYAAFVAALDRTDLVLTDSGGVLEEATALGRPALILREVTERPEAVATGVAALVGVERHTIAAATLGALAEIRAGVRPTPHGVFGDGHAADRTIDWLRWRHGLAAEAPAPFAPEPATEAAPRAGSRTAPPSPPRRARSTRTSAAAGRRS